MPKLKTLVIRRSDWLHGNQKALRKASPRSRRLIPMPLASSLRSSETKQMCCLGHLGKALGISTAALTDIPMPQSLNLNHRNLYPSNGDDLNYCARINDDPDLDDTDREAKLIEKFKGFGFRLSFVGRNTIRKAR